MEITGAILNETKILTGGTIDDVPNLVVINYDSGGKESIQVINWQNNNLKLQSGNIVSDNEDFRAREVQVNYVTAKANQIRANASGGSITVTTIEGQEIILNLNRITSMNSIESGGQTCVILGIVSIEPMPQDDEIAQAAD